MRSTYDRTGHNHTADASHYLYQEAHDFHVTLDVEGSGVLYFARSNRWHGSPWHYEIDGRDHIVEETSTANPLQPADESVFLPEAAFPAPLTYTYATTHGADLNWVPMPFARRLRLGHSRTYYGTGYYIYHLIAEGTQLTSPVTPWDSETRPDARVLALLAGTADEEAPDEKAALRTTRGALTLPRGSTVIADLRDGPAMLRTLVLTAPASRAEELANVRLRITWDDRAAPSVDAPLALFFGAGTLHVSDAHEWLVRAFPVSIRFGDGRVQLACRFPMPYFRSARIELASDTEIDDVSWLVGALPYREPWNHVGYFHATYRDHGEPVLGRDLVFLDTQGIEGADDWSGSFVGTSFVFTDRGVLSTLEGDPRFFFDDSRTPQAQGTGTEEWGGGGDYWGGRTMTLPFVGHPVGAGLSGASTEHHPEDLIHSAYRFLLADLMPFGRRAVIHFEHGGENESQEHYRSVCYWYGLPSATLVLTDRLDVGDAASESAHAYESRDATRPYTIESRYEWGPDHLPASITAPLAHPRDYVDYEFDASAGRYDLWVELRVGERLLDASVWPQLNDDIGTDVLRLAYMGTVGFVNAGRRTGTYAFCTAQRPTATVDLRTSGRQRLRLQPRHGKAHIARVLLSRDCKQRPGLDYARREGDIELTTDAVVQLRGAFAFTTDSAAPGGTAIVLGADPMQLEIYPATTMTGRRTLTASEFTLALRADNHGVLLRRTLDYAYANQRAKVLVQTEAGWAEAGIWYLAGSNTVYHSFPWSEGELGAARPVTITSNRRFRDDEFLLPAHLTRGRGRIRLRIELAPRNPPLLTGGAPLPTAWTELAYEVWCYVMPTVELGA